MGVEILNSKFIGLYFVMFFFYAAIAENKGPVLEVVSIYNDDFTTPDSREPYFIEVHRCVDHYSVNCLGLENSTIPEQKERIEIFVPDLNNRKKFYRYVVYNHTSCKCGSSKERKLNGKMREVNETEFRNGYRCNPVNLRNKREFCDKPQPRYRQHTDFEDLTPQSRYYLQYQCLPGCLNVSMVKNVRVRLRSGFPENRNFSSDNSCTAYIPSKGSCTRGKKQQSNPTLQKLFGSKKSSNDNESNDNLIISIGSTKLFLGALVLSFVLLIILILDFGPCRKKKGFFYAMCSCTGSNNSKDFGNNYEQRNGNEVTV